jgi:hypothetical protein
MIKVRYKTPREVLGKWLALNTVGGFWSDHYNEEQKEFWYRKADKLIDYIKQHGLV